MNSAVLLFDEVLDVGESNGLLVDSNVLEEVSKITPSSLVDVGKESVFVLGVILELGVSADLVVHLVSEDMLVTEKILDFALVNWHSFLLSILHGVILMLISILKGKVFLLADLGQFFGPLIRASLIDQIERVLFGAIEVSVFISNQMEEDISLLLIQSGENWHKFLKVLLILFVLFVLSFGSQIQFFNIELEFIG